MRRALTHINRTVMKTYEAVSRPHRRPQRSAPPATRRPPPSPSCSSPPAPCSLSLLILFMIQRSLRPLRDLREPAPARSPPATTASASAVGSHDEIGQLALEFNTMAEALSARDAELERQREELLRADRLATIGKMAAQITHEVRNPLSSIALNAELLEEELDSADAGGEARAILGQIDQEVQRLKAITEEYLTYARLPRPVLQPLDVGAQLAELLRFVSRELDLAQHRR
jgi:two-component system NtrC family sensor kinase